MTPTATARRNLAAECRAVEEGHRARLANDGRSFVVVSDTRPGTVYEVTPTGVAGYLRVSCSCPAGSHARTDLGVLPCKHAALVARRLERAKLVAIDGQGYWRITARAAELAPPAPADSDPFDGLA